MMDGDKEAGEKAGSYDKSYDDGDVLRVERGAGGGGRGVVAYCVLFQTRLVKCLISFTSFKHSLLN